MRRVYDRSVFDPWHLGPARLADAVPLDQTEIEAPERVPPGEGRQRAECPGMPIVLVDPARIGVLPVTLEEIQVFNAENVPFIADAA